MTKKKVFGSICAQHDNLGDIAIRRVFFKGLEENDTQLILLTHGMPTTYVDLFGFSEDVELIASPFRFQLRLLQAALKGQADLVYAPGPHILKDSLPSLSKTLLMLLNILLVRSFGGSILTAGRALRGDGRVAKFLERILISLSKAYFVRDSVSAEIVGAELQAAPDLAFGQVITPRDGERRLIACSFRNDEPINTNTFEKVVRQLGSSGFEVVLVSQVKRDDFQHELLATQFGLDAYLWKSKSHGEQQAIVDATYAASFAVVSNRLHGLIFGITCGALPVEYRILSSDKIRSTLAPWFKSIPVIDDKNGTEFSLEDLPRNDDEFNLEVFRVHEMVCELLGNVRAEGRRSESYVNEAM
jgi:hypothetical protein